MAIYETGYSMRFAIEKIFDDGVYDLAARRRKLEEEIDAWAQNLRSWIQKHAEEQKKLLQSHYDEQRKKMSERKTETLSIARDFYFSRHNEQLKDQLEECRKLKFELLVEFNYEDKSCPFIRCMTKENLAENQKFESSTSNTGNDRFGARSAPKDDKE